MDGSKQGDVTQRHGRKPYLLKWLPLLGLVHVGGRGLTLYVRECRTTPYGAALVAFSISGWFIIQLIGGTRLPGVKQDWRAQLPTFFQSGNSRSAVCPDGTLHVVGEDSRLISVDRDGHLTFVEQRLPVTQVTALACSEDGKLYLAGRIPAEPSEQLLVLRPENGYRVLFRSRLEVSALSMAVGHEQIFVAGFRQHSPFPLHLMSVRGKILRSFGESGGEQVNPALAKGFLLLDANNARLLFTPQDLPEVQVYDYNGNQLQVKGLGSNQPALLQLRREYTPQITGVGLLSNGTIIVQSVEHSSPDSYLMLDLLDPNLKPLVSIHQADFSVLVGGDFRQGMYFIGPNDITHAHLLNGSPEPQHRSRDRLDIAALDGSSVEERRPGLLIPRGNVRFPQMLGYAAVLESRSPRGWKNKLATEEIVPARTLTLRTKRLPFGSLPKWRFHAPATFLGKR